MNGMIQHFTVLRSDERAVAWADVLEIVKRELLFRNAATLAGDTTMHVTVAGTRVHLSQRAERYEAPEDGLTPVRVWEPSAALGAHASHVAITLTPRDSSELAALLTMKIGLTLSAAIAEAAGDVLAVHTLPNDAFLPPEVVETVLAAFAAGEVPHEILVQYAAYHPQNEGLRGTIGMLTKGLLPLAGFEIAVAPTMKGGSEEAYRCAVAAVRRQIVEGVALRDGETLETDTGPVEVRLVAEWLVPGIPMAVLVPEGAAIEADTLCVRPEYCTAGSGADEAAVTTRAPKRRGFLARLLAAGLKRDRSADGGAAA